MSTTKIDYVQGLIDYIVDTKPFHCKLTQVIEEYQFFDTINVKVTDAQRAKIKLSSLWEKSYYVDGWQKRFLTPSYNLPRYSLEANRHHFTDIPNDKLQYLINSYNLDNCYQLRAARGIESIIANNTESLAEGFDYHISQGMYSFNLNAIGSLHRTWIDMVSGAVPYIGDLVVQKDPLNPVVLRNIEFTNTTGLFDTWTVEFINYSLVEHISTSDNNWLITHNLNSENVVWQIYLQPNSGVESYEAIIASNVAIPNPSQLDINFSSPYIGKVVLFEAKPHQIFDVNTISNTWNINHNFNTKKLFIQPLIETVSGFEYIIPAELIIIDDYNIQIEFTQPHKGKVFVIELNNDIQVPIASTTWTLSDDFSNNKTPLFQVFAYDQFGILKQEIPESVIISDTEFTVTFSIPKSGFISFAQVDSLWYYEVSSESLGFIQNATVIGTTLLSTISELDQIEYQVDHDPSTVTVSVNGIPQIKDVNFYSKNSNTIVINNWRSSLPPDPNSSFTHQWMDAGELIEISAISNRVHTQNGISFDILGASDFGAIAYISLREKGITIREDAPEETWTLIKVNPISYNDLVPAFVGLAQAEAITYTWPSTPPAMMLPAFDYLRQLWKLEVVNIIGNVAILEACNLVTGQFWNSDIGPSGPNVISSVPNTTSSFDAFPFLKFNIIVGERGLQIGDSFRFTFGYDRDWYEQFNYDNSYFTELSTHGVKGELERNGFQPLKILPLGSAYPNAVTELITLTFESDPNYDPILFPQFKGGAFKVTGSVSGEHPYAFLGREYDNGLVRFRLVRSSELFDKYAMFADPNGYCMDYTQRAIDLKEFRNGDQFYFRINADRPNYLVHGSLSGFSEPAVVGKYYWNGKIGFQLDAPVYSVSHPTFHDAIISTGTLSLGPNASITFHTPPRFDTSDEKLLLKFHSEAATSMKLRSNDRQFLAYSSTRGQLPAVQINERYTEWECAERMSDRTFIYDFTINDPINSLLSNEKLAIDVVANQFKMVHSKDVLLLNAPYSTISKLDVNTYQEDTLTIELETDHPELGSFTSLVPTYLLGSDYKNAGYDGNLLVVGQNSSSDPMIIIENEVPYLGGFIDASFQLDPYSTTWDGYDPGYDLINARKKQNPVIPDRSFNFEIWLSDVAYEDEVHHNKVGTLTWQYDEASGFSRQVLDFTDHFASHYLKLNTKLNLKVAQADEYNDLTRILISERLHFKETTGFISSVYEDLIDLTVFEHLDNYISQQRSTLTDSTDDYIADTSINDFSLSFTSTYEVEELRGYDIPEYPTILPYDHLGYDTGTFTYNLSEEDAFGNQKYTFWGYEQNPWVTEIFIQLQSVLPTDIGPWKLVPYVFRSFSTPVRQIIVELEGNETTLELFYNPPTLPSGILGSTLIEGFDYQKIDITPVTPLNARTTYKLIIDNPCPCTIVLSA